MLILEDRSFFLALHERLYYLLLQQRDCDQSFDSAVFFLLNIISLASPLPAALSIIFMMRSYLYATIIMLEKDYLALLLP